MVAFRSASAWMTVAVLFVCTPQAFAGLGSIHRMMSELAPDSAQSSEIIRRVYQDHLGVLALREYGELAGALDNGGLVPLPDNPLRFNIVPRLDGAHPIGEKDLANQSSYIAARPATIGALLEIASRVKSGPLEITSLVRHGDYQDSLRTTNPNASTSVPMHTMGLAIDIALINTPLNTIVEIRNVLQRMQDAGDILFIAERKQLVFHVVPHPSRLGYFNDVYLRAVGEPLTSRSAGVVAFVNAPGLPPGRLTPEVTTEIIAMVPAEGPKQNLLAEDLPAEAGAIVSVPASNRWRLLPFGFACAVGWLLFPSGRARRRSLLEMDPSPTAGRLLFRN
ncbi:MAG TPA: DUF5715 family protein [Vicinamibacterales bacterium]|nr:DUF5715 family protein [Vicinamibacterales bacterium]